MHLIFAAQRHQSRTCISRSTSSWMIWKVKTSLFCRSLQNRPTKIPTTFHILDTHFSVVVVFFFSYHFKCVRPFGAHCTVHIRRLLFSNNEFQNQRHTMLRQRQSPRTISYSHSLSLSLHLFLIMSIKLCLNWAENPIYYISIVRRSLRAIIVSFNFEFTCEKHIYMPSIDRPVPGLMRSLAQCPKRVNQTSQEKRVGGGNSSRKKEILLSTAYCIYIIV